VTSLSPRHNTSRLLLTEEQYSEYVVTDRRRGVVSDWGLGVGLRIFPIKAACCSMLYRASDLSWAYEHVNYI